MQIHPQSCLPALLVLALASPGAKAQFNQQWLNLRAAPERLVTAVPLSDVNHQAHFASGDLNQDGWMDVVVMRKQPFTTVGKRANVLLINDQGVLTDRTSEFASKALGAPLADLGFLTPTNDRASAVVDVNGDGWLDVVTAVTTSDGDPKHIGHPRVYLNLGEDGAGQWLGLCFENARFPQLFSFASGLPQNPRFTDVSAGDLDRDGACDLYFVDHDSSLAGGSFQPAGFDLNDRLLFNDGNGFFTDGSQASMTPQMLASDFGVCSHIVDINGDGAMDVVKVTAGSTPSYVHLSYNQPSSPGNFNTFQSAPFVAPYFVDVGDLNNDGRLDVVVVTDFGEKYALNTGTDALGRVIFGPVQSVEFLTPTALGWGGDTHIADLDGDGWNDVIVTDLDADLPSFAGRTAIYHNLGGAPGGNPVLREEREFPTNAGWVSAVGLTANDLRNTHDVAVLDIDNDGDLDLLISRREGDAVWLNTTDPIVCQADLGFGGPGTATLSVCGAPLWAGNGADLKVQGAPAGAPTWLVVGPSQGALGLFGGTLVPDPVTLVPQVFVTNGSGDLQLPVFALGYPALVNVQAVVFDPTQPQSFQITNAVAVQFH